MVSAMRFSWMHAIAVVVGFTGIACAQIMGMEEPDVVDVLPGEGGSGQGGGGTGGASGCSLTGTLPCYDCVAQYCCAELTTCYGTPPCDTIATDVYSCMANDSMSTCVQTYNAATNPQFADVFGCMTGTCLPYCG
jgi:hypothetical protein